MTDERIKATVRRSRNVKPFAGLSNANNVLLTNTKEKRDGWFHECMAAILMAAFKVEAYLNHVGAALFPYWEEMERLPHKAKLNIIRSHLGIDKTDGERPYQTLTDLFCFRDAIAHGKNESLAPPETTEVGTLEEIRRRKPLTRWEELCTIEFAQRAYEDTEEIIKQIHNDAGLDEADLYHIEVQGYSISNVRKHDVQQ